MNIELLHHNSPTAGEAQPGDARPDELAATDRTRLKRLPERGSYRRDTVEAILDEGFVCHLAFTSERGPVVIPTSYGRVGDRLYVHGSPASRMPLLTRARPAGPAL